MGIYYWLINLQGKTMYYFHKRSNSGDHQGAGRELLGAGVLHLWALLAQPITG